MTYNSRFTSEGDSELYANIVHKNKNLLLVRRWRSLEVLYYYYGSQPRILVTDCR